MADDINIVLTKEFQEEVASLIVNDVHFASRFHGLVFEILEETKGQINFFMENSLNKIVQTFYKTYIENERVFPTLGVLKNAILADEEMDKTSKEDCLERLSSITNIEIPNKAIHEKMVCELVRAVYVAHFVKKTNKDLNKSGDIKIIGGLAEKIKAFSLREAQITFQEPSTVWGDDLLGVIEDDNSEALQMIPTGFTKIDEKLGGGVSREEVSVIASGVNEGKSAILLNISVHNAMNVDNKVLHISLEGKRNQPIMRAIAKSAKIKFSKLKLYRQWREDGNIGGIEKYFNKDELSRIRLAEEKLGKNMRFSHEIKRSDIESLIPFIREKFNEDPFDLVVVDYIQKVRSKQIFPRPDLELGFIIEELERLAADLKVAVFTAVQIKNEGLNKLREKHEVDQLPYPCYEKSHIADSKKILDSAGTALTWNRTPQELKEKKGRIAILKAREAETGYQIGLEANWDYLELQECPIYCELVGEGDTSTTLGGFRSDLKKELMDSGLDLLISDNNKEAIVEAIESNSDLMEAKTFDDIDALVKVENTILERVSLLQGMRNLSLSEAYYSESEIEEMTTEIKKQIDGIDKSPEFKRDIVQVFGENFLEKLKKIQEYEDVLNKVEDLDNQDGLETFIRYTRILVAISDYSEKLSED